MFQPAAAATPAFMPIPGGGAMPMTPGILPVASVRPPPSLQNSGDIKIMAPENSVAGGTSDPGTAGHAAGSGVPNSPTAAVPAPGSGVPSSPTGALPRSPTGVGLETTPTPVFPGNAAQLPSQVNSETTKPNTGVTLPIESVPKEDDEKRQLGGADAEPEAKRQRLDGPAPTEDSQTLFDSLFSPEVLANHVVRTPVVGAEAGDATPMTGSAAQGDAKPLEVKETDVAARKEDVDSHPPAEPGTP